LRNMGFRPGPVFSQILKNLEDAQLEGQVKSREEATEFVLARFGSAKGGPELLRIRTSRTGKRRN
jgi:hypothetical protein